MLGWFITEAQDLAQNSMARILHVEMLNMAYRKIAWRLLLLLLLLRVPGLHLRGRLLLMLMLPFQGLASWAAIVLLLRASYATIIIERV